MRPGPDRLIAAQQALANLGVTVADLQHPNLSNAHGATTGLAGPPHDPLRASKATPEVP